MDPGYGATAKMVAESPACLVQDCIELSDGFYTSAPTKGERLVERLTASAGMRFSLETLGP